MSVAALIGTLVGFGQCERNLHCEASIGIGSGFGLPHHALLSAFRTAPPEGVAAIYPIAHLGSLHRHPGKTHGFGFHLQGVAGGIALVHLGELQLEGGTLVLFHPEILVTATRLQRVASRELSLGQQKVGMATAIVIGGERLLLHHLAVGIAECHLQLPSLHGLCLLAIGHGCHDGRHIHGLSGAIDGAVGHDFGLLAHSFHGIICIRGIGIGHGALLHGTVAAGIGIEAHLPAGIVGGHGLSVLVTHQLHGLRLFLSGIGGPHGHPAFLLSVFEFQVSPGQRLSGCGIHHRISRLPGGQRLCHHIHIRHKDHAPPHARGRRSAHFEHIHTHWQRLQFERVLEELPGGTHLASLYHAMVGHQPQLRFHTLVVVGIVGVEHEASVGLQPTGSLAIAELIDIHLHCIEVSLLVYMQPVFLSGQQLLFDTCLEHRGGEFLLGIAQFAGPLPLSPVVECIVDITDFVFGGHIAALLHQPIALHGRLSRHIQVAVDVDERVELHDAVRLLQFAVVVLDGIVEEIFQGGETSGSAVSVFGIMVVERAVVAHGQSHDGQHRGAENRGIGTLHHERQVTVFGCHGKLLYG